MRPARACCAAGLPELEARAWPTAAGHVEGAPGGAREGSNPRGRRHSTLAQQGQGRAQDRRQPVRALHNGQPRSGAPRPSGRSRVAWDVACGRAGCFAASTFIAWSTHLFCGWTRWALPFQAGVRTGGCVLAAFQPYDCETRRMTSVSCLRHSYAGLRLSHTLGRALQRTPSGASIQEVCHSARACAHRTVCFGFCTRPVLLCEGGPADAGQHAAGAARHSRHSSR